MTPKSKRRASSTDRKRYAFVVNNAQIYRPSTDVTTHLVYVNITDRYYVSATTQVKVISGELRTREVYCKHGFKSMADALNWEKNEHVKYHTKLIADAKHALKKAGA